MSADDPLLPVRVGTLIGRWLLQSGRALWGYAAARVIACNMNRLGDPEDPHPPRCERRRARSYPAAAMPCDAPDVAIRLTGFPNDEVLGCDARGAATVAAG